MSSSQMPAHAVARHPASLSREGTPSIRMRYPAAWSVAVEGGGLRAGRTVIVTLASCSVGIAVLQIARQPGAVSLATTRGGDEAVALRGACGR